MLLDDDIVKFSLNDELYTLQLTDNPEMKLKIKNGKNTYYIATKEELINNLTSTQQYNDANEIIVYYCMNDELIQLGVKENIINLQVDTISFTTTSFTITDKVKTTKIGSYIETANIEKKLTEIKYNKNTETNFVTTNAIATDETIKPCSTGIYVSIERDVINYNTNTAFNFTSNNVLFNDYSGVTIKNSASEYDYVSLYYNNVDDFTIDGNIIVGTNNLVLENSESSIEREIYTFEDVTNYTLTDVVQYGINTGLIAIEPKATP